MAGGLMVRAPGGLQAELNAATSRAVTPIMQHTPIRPELITGPVLLCRICRKRVTSEDANDELCSCHRGLFASNFLPATSVHRHTNRQTNPR
eukprot:14151244-Heterocapsa_arctica.AAC.1